MRTFPHICDEWMPTLGHPKWFPDYDTRHEAMEELDKRE